MSRPSRTRFEPWAAFGLWVVLTAVGEILAWRLRIFPGSYAHEAEVSDEAFTLLVRLAIPVFAFVIAMLAVILARFRTRESDGGEPQDGPPVRGNRRVYAAWLLATSGLTVALIINPGLAGLAAMMHPDDNADLVVKVQGARWKWLVTYPGDVTSQDQLVLPVGRTVRFEVISVDVLHSFWVPAFRVKIDAVPGRTTMVTVTPDRIGSSDTDFNLRLQCAELCGLDHAKMLMPIRVVTSQEFDAWLAAKSRAAGPSCTPSGTELKIAAANIAFDTDCLAAPAGTPFTITFSNHDAGVPHNIAIARDKAYTDFVFRGEIFTGHASRTYQVDALEAGTYYFRCDVHPSMFGTLVVAGEG